MLHGPACSLAREAFGIIERPVSFDCIRWQEDIIPHGWSTVAYETGEAVATYVQNGDTAIAHFTFGGGSVYSVGFEYGYAYTRASMPIVPARYGRQEMHPLPLLQKTPVSDIIGVSPHAILPPSKGVEVARFGRRVIVVNHRSSPIDISHLATARRLPLLPGSDDTLAGHSAVYLEILTPDS